VTALVIVFLVTIQSNLVDQNKRIWITVLFMVAFGIVVITGAITSKIDPVDPVLV